MLEAAQATTMRAGGSDAIKKGLAGDLLAPVYGWFTEWFDTRDLKEAKTLLEGLSS
jgi:predicted ATPase